MCMVLSKKEFNDRYVFFAFGDEQLQEQLQKRGNPDYVYLGDGIYFEKEGYEYCKIHPLNTLK